MRILYTVITRVVLSLSIQLGIVSVIAVLGATLVLSLYTMTEGTRLKDVTAKVDHVSAELTRLIQILQQKDADNDQRFE